MLTVEQAGLQTLIVDAGRSGYAHLGVPRSGALDLASLQVANILVGNSPAAAGLECLLRGPVLSAPGRTLSAVAPGHVLQRRDELDLRKLPTLRMWIAVAGGIESPLVLGSRTADLLGGIGPGQLRDGDTLPLGQPGTPTQVFPEQLPRSGPLRVHAGPDRATTALAAGPWRVQPDSDRTALRLDGPAKPLTLQAKTRGLVTGAIQLPPDGQPVIFLAGHPATGGYPIVGFIAADDLPRLAQLRPGHTVEFRWPRPQRARKR